MRKMEWRIFRQFQRYVRLTQILHRSGEDAEQSWYLKNLWRALERTPIDTTRCVHEDPPHPS